MVLAVKSDGPVQLISVKENRAEGSARLKSSRLVADRLIQLFPVTTETVKILFFHATQESAPTTIGATPGVAKPLSDMPVMLDPETSHVLVLATKICAKLKRSPLLKAELDSDTTAMDQRLLLATTTAEELIVMSFEFIDVQLE